MIIFISKDYRNDPTRYDCSHYRMHVIRLVYILSFSTLQHHINNTHSDKVLVTSSRKHTYIILTPLNPTFI